MKVAVTSTARGLDAYVDTRFGRCPYFVVVDTETGEHEDVPNTAAESGSGAGIGAATAIAKAGAGAVLTGNVGPNAARTLQQLGIKVYQTRGGTVKEALAEFSAGSCVEVTSPTVPAWTGMGMGAGRSPGGGMGRGRGGGGGGAGRSQGRGRGGGGGGGRA